MSNHSSCRTVFVIYKHFFFLPFNSRYKCTYSEYEIRFPNLTTAITSYRLQYTDRPQTDNVKNMPNAVLILNAFGSLEPYLSRRETTNKRIGNHTKSRIDTKILLAFFSFFRRFVKKTNPCVCLRGVGCIQN